jgi:phosphodiesterase/alkaline phosphatase D-like protein
MKPLLHSHKPSRIEILLLISATAGILGLFALPTRADVSFLGVAAGDASTTGATFWTRAVDTAAPANTTLTLQITTDPTFSSITKTSNCTTDSTKDYTCKLDVIDLTPNTVYSYRFVGPANETSIVGRVKTAPDSSASVPLHFAFSGDNDGLIRPYALATQIPAQNLDFYMNLGDVIYETASNLTTSGVHNGATWLNSPSVTLSNDALNFNGIPRAFIPSGTPFATQAQLKADYERKYYENFLPVNTNGQNCLQVLYAAQGNYTTWDNHELGNRKYIDGGAPAGGSVGGPAGTDMLTGRGVDARAYTGTNTGGSGNVNNVNDVNTSSTDFMNRSTGFITLRDVFMNYQPIANRGTVVAPSDPRTDGTKRLYSAQQWGKNAIFINTDSRSYRDIRIKTANAGADDTTAPRANNPGRTYLGATQLTWLKQTLLDAQAAGTPWKFVSVSDPIDQLGPIGGALTLNNLPSFGTGSTYAPVNADGGKSYMGGYRAERNQLLKWIADNHITNVVFIATDDHQNRINELTYSPTGQTEDQSSYVKVPYVFSIVAGPLGATGPDLITNHTFSMAQQYANSIYAAQQAAGIEPLGLIGYPGLHDLVRDGDPTAGTAPQAVDFYSPDTFNFTVLDVSEDGRTLSVTSVGMDATTQNAGIEYANGPQARTLFSFKVDALPVARSGFAFDRRLNKMVQQLTITNNTGVDLSGPIDIVLTGLSGNTVLTNATGTASTGSPYITVQAESLASGASATVVLQFVRPTSGGITYGTQAVTGLANP